MRAPAHLVHHRLDPLLELAAVFGARNHHGQVKHDDPPIGQQFRNVVVNDLLRQALDDGGLADPGLAQQHRVVLLPAAEDLDDPLNLGRPADDRVEFALAGHVRQVAAEGIERGRLALALFRFRGGRGIAHFLALCPGAQQVQDFLADVLQLEAEVHQHLGRHSILLTQQTEQEVLGADIVVVELAGLFDRKFDDLFGPGGLG